MLITNFDRHISLVCNNHIGAKRCAAWLEHSDIDRRDVDSYSTSDCTVGQLYVQLHSHTDNDDMLRWYHDKRALRL